MTKWGTTENKKEIGIFSDCSTKYKLGHTKRTKYKEGTKALTTTAGLAIGWLEEKTIGYKSMSALVSARHYLFNYLL